MKMTKIQMYLIVSITLTTLPTLVTASPIPSLTRDNVAKRSKNDMRVVQYLVKYGHLDDKLDVRNAIVSQKLKQQLNLAEPTKTTTTKHDVLHPFTDDEISNGIKSLQNSLGLEVSGDLNEETVKLMESPRCGMSDKGNSVSNQFQLKVNHRSRRYAIQHQLSNGQTATFKWYKKSLTWTIYRYHKRLSNKVQDDILEKAFKIWEHSSSFTFIKKSGLNTDIRIQFAGSGNHGDKQNFDGKNGVLAHAYPPIGYSSLAGDIHFDASENWNKDYDLLSVAIHEIGHSLGLAHSKILSSVMYASYKKKTKLHNDDRQGINALYGPCKTKIDAAIYLWGDVYFLRKDMIWKIDEFDMRNTFDQGFPKKIKDELVPGIPNDVDAALVWSDYHLYVLKDTRSYGYDRYKERILYNRTIAYDWSRIPNSPDASFCYINEEITWFFKGDLCWKMNDWNLSVFPGFPKKISQVWPGLPDNIDAAYYSVFNKQTYFFKDTEYWVVDNNKKTYKAYLGGQIHQKWKGVCSEKY